MTINSAKVRGAYIHIPFCDHICYYCDFNKVFMKNQPVDDYLDALAQEMNHYAESGPPQTIYIGGGTPTALNERQFERLFQAVRKYLFHPALKEFTVEANPENLNEAKLEIMKRYGVTRLSIGVQTFDDRLLKTIGRAHQSDDAERAVRLAQRHGFDNITVDLMFALPGQTESSLHDSMERALRLGTPHISIYSLQLEPKTIFYNRMKSGSLRLPGEDIEADMFGQIILELGRHGLHHYEISNFAKPGFEGIHNSLYWRNEEYYGIGAGAHGYVNGIRYANAGPIKKYIDSVRKNGHSRRSEHAVTFEEKMEEEMFLGLRLMKGVSTDRFNDRFGCPIETVYGDAIERLKKKGLLAEHDGRLAMTQKGIFLGNDVFEAFLIS
ncbi:radical SAM family heme chaperone HemW [Sporolactobacillus inulinus]|uniref:Heme chaperone HemW n=2 Tax=Sporolactobacillus inulinus TaxID=2078 RepID=A0A0U1QMW9_9BACL|nr:radical SAM family heme chaperone HemW [Sporolactobacillus inulinus]KLI02158.1 coproporphyrinogen III oxidase [Sporolactobacillus inulinus CASD]GEB76233.1 coproporphyrinogen III oxidase [Sporolactobacillus inulinus]